MDYLQQEISDLTAFLTTNEKEALYKEFCGGGARYSTAGETTIVTIRETIRKIKTIYYTTGKSLPARNGKGQELFFFIGDTDEYSFHPDNLNVFEQTCAIHGIIPQDIKKLYKKEQIGRLLKLKYLRQGVCLGEPFDIDVKPRPPEGQQNNVLPVNYTEACKVLAVSEICGIKLISHADMPPNEVHLVVNDRYIQTFTISKE